MANCPIKDCNWKGLKAGLPIHLARMHGVHPQHDDLSEDSTIMAVSSNNNQVQVCPVPGCGQEVGDLEGHLEEKHESWRLSSGKWVFEV
jgi:hypothetical protein